ncbi:hypothetical protein [Halochromatium glycolicum]|nr:hypothetical protein [Halochromatium glycolicum]
MEDYTAAARRHWADAQLLDREQRRQNADHHYGFAAECALKSALQAMGYFREEAHRKHINVLWNRMQATAFQHRFPGLVGLLAGSNRFDDWDVEQRYHGDGAVTEEAIKVHRDCAHRLLRAVGLFRG